MLLGDDCVAMYCDNIFKSDQIQEVENSRFKMLTTASVLDVW